MSISASTSMASGMRKARAETRRTAAHCGHVAGQDCGGEQRKSHGAHPRTMTQGEFLNHLSINSCWISQRSPMRTSCNDLVPTDLRLPEL